MVEEVFSVGGSVGIQSHQETVISEATVTNYEPPRPQPLLWTLLQFMKHPAVIGDAGIAASPRMTHCPIYEHIERIHEHKAHYQMPPFVIVIILVLLCCVRLPQNVCPVICHCHITQVVPILKFALHQQQSICTWLSRVVQGLPMSDHSSQEVLHIQFGCGYCDRCHRCLQSFTRCPHAQDDTTQLQP
jgi:hypothetical protein